MATKYTIKGIQSELQNVTSENDAVTRHTINSNTNRIYAENNCGVYEHIGEGLSCVISGTSVRVNVGMGCLYGRDFEVLSNTLVEVEQNTTGFVVAVYDGNVVDGTQRFYLTSIKETDTVVQQDLLNDGKMFMMPLCSYVATTQVDDITTIQNAQLNDESLFGELTTLNNNKVNKSDLDGYVKLSNNSTTLLDSYLGYMNKDAKQPMRINNYVNGVGENTMVMTQMYPTDTAGKYNKNGFYITPDFVVHFCDNIERRIAHLDQTPYVMNSKSAKLVDAEYKNKTLDYVFWDIMNKCRANQDTRMESKQYVFSDIIDSSMPNFKQLMSTFTGDNAAAFNVEMVVNGAFYFGTPGRITLTTDDAGNQDVYKLVYNNISSAVTATTPPENQGDCIKWATTHMAGIELNGVMNATGNASVGGTLSVTGATTMTGLTMTGVLDSNKNIQTSANMKATEFSSDSLTAFNAYNMATGSVGYPIQAFYGTSKSDFRVRMRDDASGKQLDLLGSNTGANKPTRGVSCQDDRMYHVRPDGSYTSLAYTSDAKMSEQQNLLAIYNEVNNTNYDLVEAKQMRSSSPILKRLNELDIEINNIINHENETAETAVIKLEEDLQIQKQIEAEQAKANKIAQDEAIAQAQAEELAKQQQEQHIADLEQQMQLMQQELDNIKNAENDTIE